MWRVFRLLVRRSNRSYHDREDDYVAVCADGDIAAGEIRRVEGLPIVLCRTARRLYAVAFTCPHAGALLVKGRLVGDCVECPLHGARFGLERGAVRRGPARHRLRTYEVEIRKGMIHVARRPRHRGHWAS
jgi:nitrite reductase/ring-hydroxylating ferredoxin subunit